MKKDQAKGFIGAAKQSDMIIQGSLGATKKNDTKNPPDENIEKETMIQVLADLKTGQRILNQDVHEALFRPTPNATNTNDNVLVQELCENIHKSIHDLTDKTDIILNSHQAPQGELKREKILIIGYLKG